MYFTTCNLGLEMVTLQQLRCQRLLRKSEACKKGFFPYGIFLDFEKVFNTVSPRFLISKLKYYGVRGITINWFQSFLTNRKQFTSVNDYNSTYQQIIHGVPEGSVLGSLLFIFFTNDLHLSVYDRKVHHFADDTNLLFRNKSFKKSIAA